MVMQKGPTMNQQAQLLATPPELTRDTRVSVVRQRRGVAAEVMATHGIRRALALALVAAMTATAAGCVSGEAEADPDPDTTVLGRLAKLEAREDIRTTLLRFSAVVDSSDVDALPDLAPRIADDFVLDAIDFDGATHHFEGMDGLLDGFGPIMVDADANLMPSAIDVEVDGDYATATFKFANSVKPPPQLELEVDVKVLLFAANTATFHYEDGIWKMTSIELYHSLAYPGAL